MRPDFASMRSTIIYYKLVLFDINHSMCDLFAAISCCACTWHITACIR